jgi:ATP synthase protein I
LTSIKKPPVLIVPAVQAVVLGLSSAVLAADGKLDALSFLLGGLIAVVPHLYFSVYAFRHMGARAAKDITRSFYKGEVGKYLLTLVGFALVFLQVESVDVMSLFAGYLFMLLLQWWLTAKVINRY